MTNPTNPTHTHTMPLVSVTTARTDVSAKPIELQNGPLDTPTT